MIRQALTLTVPAASAALIALGVLASRPADADGARLPGARASVNAADYPSLQAALDALPAAGGAIRLPAGTFEINEPLLITQGNLLLEGEGPATHIMNANKAGGRALVIQHPLGHQVPAGEELWRITLRNFRITGKPRSGHGIHAIKINELLVQGVNVSSHGDHGIYLDGCYENPRVSDCMITYNGDSGLELYACHDTIVSANQFEENQDGVRCIDGFNLTMTGNNLDDHRGAGVVIQRTYGSVVASNMIEECKGPAIVLNADCYGNTISANVIAHCWYGIDLRDAHGCAVTGNTFTITANDALRIGPKSGRITVTGNNFSDSYIGNGASNNSFPASGVTLDEATDVTLSGNLFSGVRASPSVKVIGLSNGVVLANNLFKDSLAPETAKLQNSLVTDNLTR